MSALTSPILAPARLGTRIVVRWSINPDALRVAAPAMLNGHAAALSEASLDFEIDPNERSVKAVLQLSYGADQLSDRMELAFASCAVEHERDGLTHIDSPALLALTFDGDRAVYAATPLLARLGLPGGVYDAPAFHPTSMG